MALHANVAALEDLQRELSHHRSVSLAMSATLSEGGSLLKTLGDVKSHEIRPVLTAAIRAFERSRHRFRLRLIAVAMAEGATDQDLRHLWSISHEMVRRAKRELTALPVDEPIPGAPRPEAPA